MLNNPLAKLTGNKKLSLSKSDIVKTLTGLLFILCLSAVTAQERDSLPSRTTGRYGSHRYYGNRYGGHPPDTEKNGICSQKCRFDEPGHLF